ncbi:DUF4920 domain-containing protein [Mariniflexile sp.]|uniref:DUF4920 domain-containing protein n=1 Tax=Mariniflexile sp. TaxID=1979402 RepID=UPI00356AF014
MKNVLFVCVCLFMFISSKQKLGAQTDETVNKSFGKEIISDDAVNVSTLASKYKIIQVGDTITTKVMAKVNSVCQAKGCWMRLDLEDGNEVMVKFKDYAFFMPKDIAGNYVIINGSAFVEEVSVEEQRHYAEDAGKSAEEIASITVPKRTLSFEADGVLLVQ